MNVSDRIRNIVIRERCALQEDVVIRIVKGLLRCVSHIGMMVNRRLQKEHIVYVCVDVSEFSSTVNIYGPNWLCSE